MSPVHLDTGFLIRALFAGSAEESLLLSLLKRRTQLAISAVAWAEFACGPLTPDALREARRLLGQPVAFSESDAELSAGLFNGAGRRRGTLADCMIAAVAIRSGAALATTNRRDFERFRPHGLGML